MSTKYNIPLVRDINNYKKKFNVISTFSGGGGSCLGYKMSGGKILVANEFIEEAQKTYKLNFPEVSLLKKDIRELKGRDFLNRAGIKEGELDIFDGSPPCSAFSTAGKREKGWGINKKYSSKSQIVDDLFFEYIRILRDIKPKIFIAENVKGLTIGVAKGYLKQIYKELSNSGYNVKVKVLNACNYGVPQNRERVIFIGVRKDVECKKFFPNILDTNVKIFDAINNYKCNNYRKINKSTETFKIYNKCDNRYKRACFAKYNKKGTGYTRYKLSNKDISCTINTSQEIYHPDEPRTLSIRELKRVQSLPDDYIVTGSFIEQWERIGRMVPPLMMKNISENLYNEVLKNV